MKQLTESDLNLIRSGDNSPLTKVFRSCYDNSLRRVMIAMRCTKIDAEDVLMDSIIVLRDAIVEGKYVNENVGAYLSTVAINKLKNKNRKDYRIQLFDEKGLVLKSKGAGIEIAHLDTKVDEIIASISKLTGKCKDLLYRNLVEGVPLTMLVNELNYSSYDVVKTSKARCMSKLRLIINGKQKIR